MNPIFHSWEVYVWHEVEQVNGWSSEEKNRWKPFYTPLKNNNQQPKTNKQQETVG